MKIPFVTFKPMEAELDKELREAFDRVYTRSWYIEGVEDKAFEKAFADLWIRLYGFNDTRNVSLFMVFRKRKN